MTQEHAQDLKNAYTDAPELHPNLLVGGLHLLFWLFFHPSAWRNYVARIDPSLRSDFSLAALSRKQWGNPALRRLLIAGYILWPCLLGLAGSLTATIWSGRPVAELPYYVGYSVAHGMTSALGSGLVLSVGIGLVSSPIVSLVGGIGAVIDMVLRGSNTWRAAGTNLTMSVVCGAMVSMAGRPPYSIGRQLGGVVIGIVTGSLALALIIGVAFGITTLVTGSEVSFVQTNEVVTPAGGVANGAAIGAGLGILLAIAFGWRRGGLYVGLSSTALVILLGWLVGPMDRATFDAMRGTAIALADGVAGVVFVALPYLPAKRFGGAWAGAVAAALGCAGAYATSLFRAVSLGSYLPLSAAIIALGLTMIWWRPVLSYPFLIGWNLVLYYADERRAGSHPSLLRWHSAFWDEYQRLPLVGLDDHLVLVMEHRPAEGQAALEYIASSPQRWAAQAAQIELDARELERCPNVAAIGDAGPRLAAGELTGPASALLRSLSRVSQDVAAALCQESAYNRRLALCAIEDRLDALLRELTRSSERYAVRFRPIVHRWHEVVAIEAHELTQAVEVRQEIESPYVIGVPLTERQEVFVGRADVGAHIERLLLDRRRPPLLLYGQRRMGKTSLLNNLGRLLPSTIVPLFVDLQGPATQARDHAGFLYNVARGMIDSAAQRRGLVLPALTRQTLATDPFTYFDEWLDQIEAALPDSTILVSLDEFGTLDDANAGGRFTVEPVLSMLRHIVQHHPHFKLLLAGSQGLDELQRWASYLINMQVVHIGYLQEDEARQLVERPVKDFMLRYEPEASRRVLALTRSHPSLVQLLCAEIVALKNEQAPAVRRLARLADVEVAVPEALSHGSFFFADIQCNQMDAAGLAVLRCLAAQGEGGMVSRENLARQLSNPDDLDRALGLLVRRELIEAAQGGYRFQVELIRRWFAQPFG